MMFDATFPDLALEEILRHLPHQDRLTLRSVSSEWDAVVMTRFKTEFPRAFLSAKDEFRSFIELFQESRYGNPFTRYVLSIREPTNEELEAFAIFVGFTMTELSASALGLHNSVIWGKWWSRTPARDNEIITISQDLEVFFQRVAILLTHAPNLEYFGIMRFAGSTNELADPVKPGIIPYLPKLRIFSRASHDRIKDWTRYLVDSAPLLCNAREIPADKFVSHGKLSNVEPSLVEGYPLSVFLRVELKNGADEMEWREKLERMANLVLFLELFHFPELDDGYQITQPGIFRRVTRLYFSSRLQNRSTTLQIESAQFPALVYVHYRSLNTWMCPAPWSNAVFPKVQTLILEIRWSRKDDACWEISRTFPYLRELIFHVSIGSNPIPKILKDVEKLTCLTNVRIECCRRGSRRDEDFFWFGHIVDWKDLCGMGSPKYALKSPSSVEYGGVELSTFLPVLICGILKGNLPSVDSLTVRGYTRIDYDPRVCPNVEVYVGLLEQMFKNFTLERY